MAKKKKDERVSNEAIKTKLLKDFTSDKNARQNIDWNWFTYDLFYSGNHYARWDRDANQIITTVKDKGRPRVVINKIATTIRNVSNWALRSDPKAEVTPDDLTEDNLDDALINTKYLDYLHDKLKLRNKLRQVLKMALIYSAGYWQIMWDEDEQEIRVSPVHTYDLYWDSTARSPQEARRVTMAVRRPLSYLKDNDLYDQEAVENIKADRKLAESDIYSRFLAHQLGQRNQGAEAETVIVKEHWYKEKDKIMLATTANDVLIRKPEDTGLDRFPFFMLKSDIQPLQMYGDGWVKNMIDPQKIINRGESNVAEYNDLINKVKIVIDRGAGVKTYNNQHGQIIEKRRGYNVTQLSPAPMSPVQLQQIQNAITYIEGAGAMHDASLGRVPTGAKSGRAIEALQFGDSTSLSELTENIEEFLSESYEYILSLVAEKYQFAREIKPTTRTGEREFIKIIGESADNQPEDATVIKRNNMVDVKIGTYLAETPAARREAIAELAQVIPDLDPETILDAYGVGNIADVIARIRRNRKERMEAERQQQVGPAQGAEQAIAAIRAIVRGQVPEVPTNPNRDYLDALDAFLATPEAQSIPEDQLSALQTFRDKAAQFVGQEIEEA